MNKGEDCRFLSTEGPGFQAGYEAGWREGREEIIRCLSFKQFFSPDRLASLFEISSQEIFNILRKA